MQPDRRPGRRSGREPATARVASRSGGGIDPAILDDPEIADRLAEFMAGRGTRRAAGSPPTSAPPTWTWPPPAGPARQTIALLRRSSPAAVLDRIKAPTLLIQGAGRLAVPAVRGRRQRPRHRRDRHAGAGRLVHRRPRRRRRARRPTRTGCSSSPSQWLDHYLQGQRRRRRAPASPTRGSPASTRETAALATTGFSGRRRTRARRAPAHRAVDRVGPGAADRQPARRQPGAPSRPLPGVGAGGLSSFARRRRARPARPARRLRAPPRCRENLDVVGAPTVQIRAASPTGEAVLFVKLYDVDPNGRSNAPVGLVAPVRLTGLPTDIDAGAAGHRHPARRSCAASRPGTGCGSTVATSDQAFTTPGRAGRLHGRLPAGGARSRCRTVDGHADRQPRGASGATCWSALLALIAVGLVVDPGRRPASGGAATPRRWSPSTPTRRWSCAGCARSTPTGSWPWPTWTSRCERGQVVGLLGPNGAGKTTTLRVLMGLTQADRGARCSSSATGWRPGAECCPGSARWSRGPASCRTCTGLENLQPYWRATGRPEAEARLRRGAGDRRARRLDPPQGTQVQPRHEAAAGHRPGHARPARAAGARRADRRAGPAADRRDAPGAAALRHRRPGGAGLQPPAGRGGADLHPRGGDAQGPDRGRRPGRRHRRRLADRAVRRLRRGRGRARCWPARRRAVGGRRTAARGLVVDLNGTARTEVVAALVRAGVGVDRVVPRRRLEDAFLALVGGDSRGSGDR